MSDAKRWTEARKRAHIERMKRIGAEGSGNSEWKRLSRARRKAEPPVRLRLTREDVERQPRPYRTPLE